MARDQVKIKIEDLIVGMYVSKLDRPWIQTPFPIQGYFIKTSDDIKALKQYCNHVYIDVHRGKGPVNPDLLTFQSHKTTVPPNHTNVTTKPVTPTPPAHLEKFRKNIGFYQNTTTPRKEVRNAKHLRQVIFSAAAQIENALRYGTRINIEETRRAVSAIVNSLIRNPDAFVWIAKIKDTDSHYYNSSVRTTIWAIAYGRHLGLSRQAMENLALGILLSNVGKIRLPEEIRNKHEDYLSDDEWQIYTGHVAHALEYLSDYKELNAQVLCVVSCINERHNGTGYPLGLYGDRIPLLARIAGIAQYYDSLTFPRDETEGLTADEAMNRIYKLRKVNFQEELVDEFIQAIGIYPAGTLVELSTRETAIILEQNSERRLRPSIMLLLDPEKKPYKKFKILDLAQKEETEKGKYLVINRCLPIGAYGADPSVIYENAFSNKWNIPIAS